MRRLLKVSSGVCLQHSLELLAGSQAKCWNFCRGKFEALRGTGSVGRGGHGACLFLSGASYQTCTSLRLYRLTADSVSHSGDGAEDLYLLVLASQTCTSTPGAGEKLSGAQKISTKASFAGSAGHTGSVGSGGLGARLLPAGANSQSCTSLRWYWLAAGIRQDGGGPLSPGAGSSGPAHHWGGTGLRR